MVASRENDELTAEQKKSILDERAAFLSQTPLRLAKREHQLDVLEFIISGEHFCVEARYVREANKLQAPTPLPCTPDFVMGLINFRGQILPLLDLRKILELKAMSGKNDLMMVIVQSDLAQAGIAVDEIVGMNSIPEAELQSPKQLVSQSQAPLLKGVRSDRLALVDVPALFADQRLIVNDSAKEEEVQ